MPPLGRVGVATHRMYFADYGGIGPVGAGGNCGAHARQPGANYQEHHAQAYFFRFSPPFQWTRSPGTAHALRCRLIIQQNRHGVNNPFGLQQGGNALGVPESTPLSINSSASEAGEPQPYPPFRHSPAPGPTGFKSVARKAYMYSSHQPGASQKPGRARNSPATWETSS